MKKITVDDIIILLNKYISNSKLSLDKLDDDLSDCGMDSISFIQIVISLEEEFE